MKLADLFGGGAVVRVLDVLLAKPSLPWTRALLASSSGLDPRTVRRVMPRLAALGVVRVDREFGVVHLNTDSPLLQTLQTLRERLTALPAPHWDAEKG